MQETTHYFYNNDNKDCIYRIEGKCSRDECKHTFKEDFDTETLTPEGVYSEKTWDNLIKAYAQNNI